MKPSEQGLSPFVVLLAYRLFLGNTYEYAVERTWKGDAIRKFLSFITKKFFLKLYYKLVNDKNYHIPIFATTL